VPTRQAEADDEEDAMEKRRSLLQRKIEILRACLRDGVDASVAASYLREIAEAEHELRHLGAEPELGEC
jgi:hypothetical protein